MTGAIRRVAALYDVHGNLPALEAALAAADVADVDFIVFGGDLALGPMPREVLDRIAALGTRALSLRGNCDRLMVDAWDGSLSPLLPAAIREPVTWAARQLRPRHRDFLAALPETLTLDVENVGTVLFCHATPRSDEEVITRRTADARMRAVLASIAANVVVCGHTHMPFDRRVDGVRVANAGSVGMPFGEPGAHWLLVGPELEHRRSDYDGARAATRIEGTAYPDAAGFATRHVLDPPTEEEMLAVFAASDGSPSTPTSS